MAGRLAMMVACVVLGALLTWQAAMNAEAARRFASPVLAVLLSLSVSMVAMVVAALFMVRGLPAESAVRGAPWWMWVGGLCGALFLLGSLLMVPVLGAVLFLMCIVLGQVLGAMLADSLGLWGLQVQPLTWQRVAGLGLVLAGVILFNLRP